MLLQIGDLFGSYEIVGLLGQGGMGEVYRARDTTLKRDVALKVLPAAFLRDPEHKARFQREAEVLASLDHPNIGPIYGLVESEEARALVLALIEGPTLADRIAAGPLERPELLRIVRQTIDALEYAHDHGVVHRDLKPANVKITPEGTVKVLDFGLAKVMEDDRLAPSGADLPTQTIGLTRVGVILGTASYMSPEQAVGKSADRRSDIFSFGAVLFEALTGRRAFRGATAGDVLESVVRNDPDWSMLSSDTPEALRTVLRRCLTKDRLQRMQAIGEARITLDAGSTAPPAAPRLAALPLTFLRKPWATAAALLLALLLLGGVYLAGRRAGVAPPLSFQRLTYRHGDILSARFAPEAQTVLFSAAWEDGPVELFSMRLESPESRSMDLPGVELQAVSASSDMALLRRGGMLMDWHFRLGVLASAPFAGGAPREIISGVRFADYGPESSAMAAVRLAQGGFQIEFPLGKVLYQTPGDIGGMRVSPKGDLVAFAERTSGFGADWAIATLDHNGRKKTLTTGWPGGDLLWLAWPPSGDEVWFAAGISGSDTLRAVSLSGRVRELAHFPASFQILDVSRDGRVLANRVNGHGGFMGTLPGESKERDLSWLDDSETDDLSADGKTLLITEYGDGGGSGRWSIYLRKTDGSPAVRLGEGQAFALSPDGKWALTLRRGNPAQLVLLPTGPGNPVVLANGNPRDYLAADWLPDGKRILFAGVEPGHKARCYVQDVAGGAPRPVTPEGVTSRLGQHSISPDGAWFAAMDSQGQVSLYPTETGEPRPIPGLSPGDIPLRWSADETALFMLRKNALPVRIFRVNVATGRSEQWKEIQPADPAGIAELYSLQLAADETTYYYSYIRTLSDLYVIGGLR